MAWTTPRPASASSSRSTPPTSRSSAWLELRSRDRSAASRPRRWWSTASCTSPRRGASCTPSTCAPARSSGPSIPRCPRQSGYKGCCDVVNRGVALYKGKVFVGAYRRPADRARCARPARRCGRRTRSIDREHSYTITGAPRVVQRQGDDRQRRRRIRRARLCHRLRRRDRRAGLALLHRAGRSGQAASRTPRWRRPPRPGTRPASGGKSAAAAPSGTRMAFDPELNLLYIGTGNGSPWARKHAQPRRRRQSVSRLDRRARTPTPANTSGTTRRRPATTGTTPRPSR